MKLKILKSVPASRDGVNVDEFLADSIELIDETKPRALELANMLVRAGYAEIVSDKEAAAHLAEFAALSEGQKADLAEVRAEIAQEDHASQTAAKKERRTSKKPTPFLKVDAAVPSEVQLRLGTPHAVKPEPVKPTKPAPVVKPEPEEPAPDVIKVGAVVLSADNLAQRMTVEKLEGDTAECVWFAADNSGPFRDLFAVSSLVNAPIAEK